MTRIIPDCPDAKPNPTVAAARQYEIELITPMFGGGVDPRVNDPSFPIRPTAIRGQLQFWWRATVGAQYATSAELRAAQTELWGSTERASAVQVLLESVHAGDPAPCARIEWDQRARRGRGGWRTNWQAPFDRQDSAVRYVLFPFQGETPPPNRNAAATVPPAGCVRQATFRVAIQCPNDLWPRLEPALWAWVNFGGIGSRTRRGCGTIRCRELAPRDHVHLREQIERFGRPSPEAREWPTLSEDVLVREETGDAIDVWEWLVDRFRYFRQGIPFARNPGPGRSHYPEPEAIRTVLFDPNRPWRHERLDHIPNDAFPRAELGLPIVFHFQGQQEPDQTVLYPADGPDGQRRERMASPLILKPLALADGKAVPLILRLNGPALTAVDLRRGETALPLPSSSAIRDPRLATYPHSPLAGSPNGSALEAFLAFARSEGFQEVSR